MKTIFDLDDELPAEADARAALEQKSLSCFVEEGLRLRLNTGFPADKWPRSLPVFERGTGLQPGIDPTRNQSMLDALGAGS